LEIFYLFLTLKKRELLKGGIVKKVLKISVFVTLLLITAFIVTNVFFQVEISNEPSTVEIEKRLSSEIAKLPSGSQEAMRLASLFERVHKKSNGRYNKSENPGAFLEALKEIKTAYDGTTYKPDYKIKALKKSEERKRLNRVFNNEELAWEERGPGNVSGRTQQLIVDAADQTGNTWFAATIGGGVWKTTNSGQTWENKTPQLSTLSTTTIAQCEADPDVIYVGTGMGFGRVVDLAGSGVWKSTDHGETFNQLPSTANNELLAAINRIIVNPSNSNLVIVCSNDDYTSFGPNGGERKSGIFRSTDGGATWIQVYDPDASLGTITDNRVQQLIADPTNFNNLYAAVNEIGVLKSTDAGLTWQVSADYFARPQDIGAAEGSYQGISTRTELAIAPSDPNRIYAAVERRLGVADLYMSKDAGFSWVLVDDTGNDPNWFNATGASGATGAYTAGWFDNTIVVSPYDKNVVFVGGVEIYRININENNNTRTTTEVGSTTEVHADHHDLDIIPVNQSANSYIIVNSNDGGIGVSYDRGNNWVQITGLGSTQFYGVDKKPGEDAYFGGTQDNGTWISGNDPNSNSNWNHVIGGDGFEAAWSYGDTNLLVGGSQNAVLSRSTDGGITWTALPDAKVGAAPFITKIASSDIDPDLLFVVCSGGITRSDNFGATWTLTTIPGNWLGFRAFDNAEISSADPQIVWITSPLDSKPWIGSPGGIHVSTDAGLTFTEVSQNFPNTVTESSGIATHPFDPNTAFMLFSAAGTPKILMTSDLGASWTDISGFTNSSGALNKSNLSENESTNGFPDVAVFTLLVMPYDTNILWAGTEIGLFISSDGGVSWNIADNGLPKVGIFQMFIQDGQVVVATYGRGIWTVDLPELANYELPNATLSPRLNPVVQSPGGNVLINVDLRSPYESTSVRVNGEVLVEFTSNEEPRNQEIFYPVTKTETITVQVISYKDGREFKSPQQSVTVFPSQVQDSYVSNFSPSSGGEDFTGNGFSVRTVSGFAYAAIHSNHPYGVQNDFIYQLKIPIRVASANAIFQYDDVALVEEGVVNDYTNTNFFDYVIVEGSIDGITWIPLLNGYDSRFDPVWSQAYNSGLAGYDSNTPGNESMYRTHTINLLNFFNAGDIIFVRFRLSSDALAVAWGWAIDNIKIQSSPTRTDSDETLPTSFALEQNYPNPFNPSTTINYSLPVESNVELKVYNIQGREITTLVNDIQSAGNKKISWNGTNNFGNQVTSGIYFYVIKAGDFVQSKKMILLR